MANKKSILTYSGLKKLEDELEYFKVVRRKDVAEKIKEARAQGDLSENAEYDAAKDEQGEIESRIAEIEIMLKNVEVIDEDEVDISSVNIGCKVRLYDYEFEEETEFFIVGSAESDPLNNKISNESPIGEKILGKVVGDEIDVETKAGTIKFKVLEIHR